MQIAMYQTNNSNSAIQWARQLLPQTFTECTALTPDAGARRYFQLQTKHRALLLVDQSNGFSKKKQFNQLQQLYTEQELIVPQTLYSSSNDDYLLLEYFGNVQLADKLNISNVHSLYREALALLKNIRRLPQQQLPRFDTAFYNRELHFFKKWYLEAYQQHYFNYEQTQSLQHGFDHLITMILQQLHVSTHRDYHSRNIMCLPNNSMAIIDFQDTAIAPISYDVVSLIYDAYVNWPDYILSDCLSYHYYSSKLINKSMSLQQWLTDCNIMSIQRHLKALGTFAYKIVHEKDFRYLPALQNCERHLQKNLLEHEELFIIAQWIKN